MKPTEQQKISCSIHDLLNGANGLARSFKWYYKGHVVTALVDNRPVEVNFTEIVSGEEIEKTEIVTLQTRLKNHDRT